MGEARPANPPLSREILRAGGRSYPWAEILAGAYFRGDAAPIHAETADALATLRYAGEEGFPVPEEEAGAAGEAFRAEHGLITGEEMDRWLERCGIALEEFDAHFASRIQLARFSARLPEIRRDYAPGPEEAVGAMWPATILSGCFEALALPFARRVANRLDARGPADPAEADRALREGAPRVPEPLRGPGLLDELAALESLYLAAERAVASAAACREELRERSWQLTRLVVVEAVFPALDQAREARQGVIADGLPLEELASRAGVEPAERTIFADETPEGTAALLSAARPGSPLAPEPVEDGYLLRLVRRRIEPDLADPEVADRVRRRLLAAHFDTLVSAHVAWSFDPWTTT